MALFMQFLVSVMHAKNKKVSFAAQTAKETFGYVLQEMDQTSFFIKNVLIECGASDKR